MKRIMAPLTIAACMLLPSAGAVFATGQPGAQAGVTCLSAGATDTPGHAANSPGSPFDEPGTNPTNPAGGKAGTHYAGNPGTASAAHSQSGNAVSEYDIACKNVTANQMP